MGWAVYNLLNTENSTVADNKGYVMSATKQAGVFASNEGWGTMDMGDVLMDETTGKPWVDEDGAMAAASMRAMSSSPATSSP